MTTTQQSKSGRVENWLPDDVSLYIGKKTLVKLILGAAEDIDVRYSDYGALAPENSTLRPAMMLTLLTYCFARGIYAAADIQLGTQHDQMIRYLCARTYPDSGAIRSFRRYQRERIKRCLAAVLRQVWELRFCGDEAQPMEGISYAGLSLSRWADWKRTPDFERDAEQRIARAIRADSMAMDV
jgi:hypothetical protein